LTTPLKLKKKRKKLEIEAQPWMANLYRYLDTRPQTPLQYMDRWGRLIDDPNRQYSRKLTHMFSWEILDLAELLKSEIESPRLTIWRSAPSENLQRDFGHKKRGRPPKYDHINRLIFVLEFLATGCDVHKAEFEYQYSKTSIDEDRKHVLKAVIKILDNQIRWPTAAEREQLKDGFTGILEGMVGIMDVTE
jgi:hypothetical protein